MVASPQPIKEIHGLRKQGMSAVLFKAHRRNGGIRKKLCLPLAAPSTPPHRPDNSAPPSIKGQRKALEEARRKLQF